MGREEQRQVVLPVPARMALRLLFSASGEYFRAYHSEFTRDPCPGVTAWDSGRRLITFKKRLDVPAPVLKLLGDPCVSVTETQELAPLGDDASTLVVTSTAYSKGFERFQTKTQYTLVPTGVDSCTLQQLVTCEAPPLGFGMQGVVEKCMCNIAAESLDQQMKHAVEFVQKRRSSSALPSPLPGEPPAKSKARSPRGAEDTETAATLRRSASLKRRRSGVPVETVSPTVYYDAEGGEAEDPVQGGEPEVSPLSGQLGRRQSLRRRVASPSPAAS